MTANHSRAMHSCSNSRSAKSPMPTTTPINRKGVGLAQAKKIALLYNPTMRAARLNARVPVVSATQAGLLDDPELGIDVTRLVQFADNPWTVGSSLAMTLPLSGRLALERQTATAEGSAALVEAWTIEQQVLHQLELEWIEGASTRRAIEEANQAHRQIDEVVEITNRLESVGEMITAEAVAFRGRTIEGKIWRQ
jgi:outer membrane protein TolC